MRRVSRGYSRRPGLLFVLPALVPYVIFYIGPSIASVWISLHAWSGPGSDFQFNAIGNYQAILKDPVFWHSFVNTMLLVFGVGIGVFVVSFFFTMVLHGLRWRRTIRAVLFFPNVVPPVALGIIWGLILDPNFGLINKGLRPLGLARQWMGPELIFPTIMLILTWIYTGFYTTIILAGVDGIPRFYYEAAEVEGASRLQQFFYVTLPMTWDVISVAAVLWVINAIKIFDFIFVFAGVGSDPPTRVWNNAVEMFQVSLGTRVPIFQLGYGTAIAVTMVFLVAVLVILLRRFLGRESIEF